MVGRSRGGWGRGGSKESQGRAEFADTGPTGHRGWEGGAYRQLQTLPQRYLVNPNRGIRPTLTPDEGWALAALRSSGGNNCNLAPASQFSVTPKYLSPELEEALLQTTEAPVPVNKSRDSSNRKVQDRHEFW